MTEISIMIEAPDGVNWRIWKRLVEEVDALGFRGMSRRTTSMHSLST
jgi:hypothetical protein